MYHLGPVEKGKPEVPLGSGALRGRKKALPEATPKPKERKRRKEN